MIMSNLKRLSQKSIDRKRIESFFKAAFLRMFKQSFITIPKQRKSFSKKLGKNIRKVIIHEMIS